jgi:hypothetical protein
MGYFAGTSDLRNLLAMAARLRRLADETRHPGDRKLYLTAAAVLEARADQLATHPPGNPFDPALETELHRPVDIRV